LPVVLLVLAAFLSEPAASAPASEQQRITTLAGEPAKQQARTALNQTANQAPYETTLLGAIFKRMYSLDNTRLERVFPNTVPLDLGLV
jgi:hypothetical protein